MDTAKPIVSQDAVGFVVSNYLHDMNGGARGLTYHNTYHYARATA